MFNKTTLRAALILVAGILFAVPAHGEIGSFEAAAAAPERTSAAAKSDRKRPRTTLRSGPRGVVQSASASFRFSSDERLSRFECRLDGGRWRRCAAPKRLLRLSAGRHVFRVRARDRAGNVDASPAWRRWTVEPASTPEPAASSATTASGLLSATFDGVEGILASDSAFWGLADLGLTQSRDWFAESGTMYRRAGLGWTDAPVFRLWSRSTDLAFTKAEMDIRFNGWAGGTEGWDGVNLWLNRKLRTPSSGSRINDGLQQEGYAVDFLNRDGRIYIQKKVGDTYHVLAQRQWRPTPGAWYRWGGRVIDNGNATSTIQVLVDGQVILQVTDNGSLGGPRLVGGRMGLRGDYADFNVNNLTISRG